MNYKTHHKVLVIAVPVLSIAVLGAVLALILANFSLMPCLSYTYLHVLCPACGATRAVTSLMHGDVLMSLRQNAAVIILIILALLFYIELVLKVFGKSFRFPMIHNMWFYYVLAVLLIAYMVARNFIPEIAPVGTRAGLGLTY